MKKLLGYLMVLSWFSGIFCIIFYFDYISEKVYEFLMPLNLGLSLSFGVILICLFVTWYIWYAVELIIDEKYKSVL